jgi:serine/threonine-protein kinase
MLGGTISNYSNFKVIDSKTTDKGITPSGNPAYQIVYTYSLNGVPTKGIEVGTVLNGKAYFLTFEAPVSNYDSSTPIIQQMIDSFRLPII